jgi:tRNA (guanine37-N1)-methyltransferase
VASELATKPWLLFLCGRYEGVDERIREYLVDEELSIGNYVLTGGELAALVVIDALARHIPGVLGAEHAAKRDSFADGLLEGPHYTRPETFRGWSVPEVLRSGHAERIRRWRREQALRRTWERRPELLLSAELDEADRLFLMTLASEHGG